MIMEKLKQSTREQHEALESVVDVMSKTFTLDDYKSLLTKFYRFYSAVEPKLPVDGLLQAGFDIAPRRKTPLLERDLAALGILDQVRAVPAWQGVPAIDGVAAAFGGIYVIEGATLGGQLIKRQLKESLDVTEENGGAFFNSYGADVGRMWKEFRDVMTAYSEKNPDDDEAVVNSARETFDSFRRCFEQPVVAGA